jgi:hypothetical protein
MVAANAADVIKSCGPELGIPLINEPGSRCQLTSTIKLIFILMAYKIDLIPEHNPGAIDGSLVRPRGLLIN